MSVIYTESVVNNNNNSKTIISGKKFNCSNFCIFLFIMLFLIIQNNFFVLEKKIFYMTCLQLLIKKRNRK